MGIFNAAKAVDLLFGDANLMNFAHADHKDFQWKECIFAYQSFSNSFYN